MSEPDQLLLQQALATISGDRRKDYGNPEDNFQVIADLWNAYLAHRHTSRPPNTIFVLSSTDVAALMVLMKVARLIRSPDHADSWRDIAGYAACGARVSDADLGPVDMAADPAPGVDLFQHPADPFMPAVTQNLQQRAHDGHDPAALGIADEWRKFIDHHVSPHHDTLDGGHLRRLASDHLGLDLSEAESEGILFNYLNRKDQTDASHE